jgi:hypothetical protein
VQRPRGGWGKAPGNRRNAGRTGRFVSQ